MRATRRQVLKAGAGVMTGMLAGSVMAESEESLSAGRDKFKLNFGPHFGMFSNHAGGDLVDQLKFASDEGFTAWEDNGMMSRSAADQERVAKAMSDLGMTMGVFVADAEWSKPVYALGGAEAKARLVDIAKRASDVAKRVNARWMTVVPGPYDLRLAWEYQTANVIDSLRWMVEVFEPNGLVMVLEPLNPYRDHPGMFLSKVPQAYEICRAIDSPSCKILFDMYHQQITEGNIIPNIDAAWSEIAYFQAGDNPGRNEPTTGEMNYRNIFRHISKKSTEIVIGMEHGNSVGGKEGERKVIDAYRACQSW